MRTAIISLALLLPASPAPATDFALCDGDPVVFLGGSPRSEGDAPRLAAQADPSPYPETSR
jgi:hypothetical protein